MKIGILTYHLSHNYGAFLQAYALTMRLKEEFPEDSIEIINFNMPVAEKYYKKVIWAENRFKSIRYNIARFKTFEKAKDLLPTGSNELHSNSMEEFINMVKGKYDIIIAGSDEIWRLTGSRGFPNPYWLPGDLQCVKMSYAASSRSDFTALSDEKQKVLQKLLNGFYYIGVRDSSTYESVLSVVENKEKVHMNCDPTLAYKFSFDREKGKKILVDKFGIDPAKNTVGMMVTNAAVVKQIKALFADRYNYVSLFQKHNGTFSCPYITPFEWIDVISALDFFVSSFFHGVCFALNTGTPFAALEKNKVNKDKSKVLDLLAGTKLEQRYITGDLNRLKDMIEKEIGTRVDYEPEITDLRNEFNGFKEAIKEIKRSR